MITKVTRKPTVSQGAIARLKQRLQRLGISQDRVAKETKVTRSMVNNVLNGRATSRRVIAAAHRLIAERQS
jgi:transcriptional regulator with XRE-family HTH domain